MAESTSPPTLNRRRLLHALAAGAVLTVGGGGQLGLLSPRRASAAPAPAPWDDPQAWPDGRVPGPGQVAVVSRPVMLTGTARVAGVVVEPDGALVFAPETSSLLETTGNVVVRGRLAMRPASAQVVHTLRFVGVDESKFVGGGMQVLDSDVGLWVVEAGLLDLHGAPKRAWTRAVDALPTGATQITVQDASGWRAGDVVAIAPTGAPTRDNGAFHQDVDHALGYDEAVVTAVSGGVVRLSKPLAFDHPTVAFIDAHGQRRGYGAEVLNLSRNVVVEGQPQGRAHVMLLHAHRPQQVSHAELRHLGPRQSFVNGNGALRTRGVLGRYGLHFHHCGDQVRGSVVEGVVVHRCGGHAFVPHDSHGVTLRECVAHDVADTAFWWDLHERKTEYRPASNDALWERCVASKVQTQWDAAEGYRMAGFNLGEGSDHTNRCIDCVAVGVATPRSTMNAGMVSGFHWPENGRAIWVFEGCLAHNIGGSGSLSWQNDERVHLLEAFTAYHCGKSGIEHGAYANFWHYRDCTLYGNRRSGLAIHAVTRRTGATPPGAPPLLFENIVVDGAELTRWGVQSEGHRFAALDEDPAVIRAVRVRGCREASFYEPALGNRSHLRFVGCQFAEPAFWIEDGAATGTLLRVENLNGDGLSFDLVPKDQPGAPVPKWNAAMINGTVAQVLRYAGAGRVETAAAVSAATFAPGVPVAFLATAAGFADALAGGPAAAAEGGPVLLTAGQRLHPASAAELRRLRPRRIVVLGGARAVPQSVVDEARAYTAGEVRRIAGDSRYATAAAVSAATFAPGVAVAYVATGQSFPDALGGGAAAASLGGPMLLVARDSLPVETAMELRRLRPGRIVVLGGTGAVSGQVETQLRGYATQVHRLAGNDRFATCAAVVRDAFATSGGSVFVATGADYPDALAAVPAAAAAGAPLLLVSSDGVPDRVAAELVRMAPSRVVVLGGTGAVSASVEQHLARLLSR